MNEKILADLTPREMDLLLGAMIVDTQVAFGSSRSDVHEIVDLTFDTLDEMAGDTFQMLLPGL